MAYLVAGKDSTLSIFLLDNPDALVNSDDIDTVDGSTTDPRAFAVAVEGNTACVVGYTHFSTFNVENENSIVQFDAENPGFTFSTTHNDVKVENGIAYVVTNLGVSSKVLIYDISSPSNISLLQTISLGQVGLPGDGRPTALEVRDGILYIVSNSGSADLIVIDVNDPLNPVGLDTINIDGSSYIDIAMEANLVYLTQTGPRISIIDISDPSDVQLVREIQDNQQGINGLDEPDGIDVVNGLIYTAALGLQRMFVLSPLPASVITSNKVGIGTNAPATELEVKGTITTEDLVVKGDDIAAKIIALENRLTALEGS